jgi:Tol biopolymer transport system component
VSVRGAGWVTRRRLLVAASSAALSAGCASIPVPFGPSPTPVRPPFTGQLILARGGDLFVDALPGLDETQIRHFAKGSLAASPAISPDRSAIVYTFYVSALTPGDLGKSYLWTIQLTGVQPRQIGALAQSGASFEDPSWSADGRSIFATIRSPIEANGQLQGEKTAVYRVGLGGANPVQLVADAQGAWASPNGKDLAYLTANSQGATNGLWVADVAGQNRRQLLANQGFSSIRAPRFSADGQWLAFAGGGGPAQAREAPRRPATAGLALFGPGLAEADGIPAEIWLVHPDGSGLRRLTHSQEHSPIPSWSPDGQWIAVLSESGLSVVDVSGKQPPIRLKKPDGTSGLCWTN